MLRFIRRLSLLAGPEGILLVDSQFAPLTDKLVAAIRRISSAPIRFLVNTHLHGDHTGGNENFAKLGVTLFSRDLIAAMRDKVAPLVAQGRTVEEVLAAKLTAPHEDKVPQGAQTAEQFIRWLYAELKGG